MAAKHTLSTSKPHPNTRLWSGVLQVAVHLCEEIHEAEKGDEEVSEEMEEIGEPILVRPGGSYENYCHAISPHVA